MNEFAKRKPGMSREKVKCKNHSGRKEPSKSFPLAGADRIQQRAEGRAEGFPGVTL